MAYMSKKKIKPDFSKPKVQKQESDSLSQDFSLKNQPDFITPEMEQFDDVPPEDKEYEGLPVVVIAGRPNVGKSTLFNRFLHRRIAIVNDQPGVTRDPVEATAIIHDKPIHLVDTGGYKLTRDIGTKEAELDEYVVEKSLEMIEKADVVILLLEAGVITGEDEEFIIKMRPYWNKVIAAVNKTEGGKNEAEAWNYAKYGFNELLFI